MRKNHWFAVLAATLSMVSPCFSAVDVPAPFMGQWEGKFLNSEKENDSPEIYAEVIASGGGKYRIQILPRFFKRADLIKEMESPATGGKIVFDDGGWKGEITPDSFTGEWVQAGKPPRKFSFTKSHFQSPTLGRKPPEGATILFDGKNLDAWQNIKDGGAAGWGILPDGALEILSMKKGAASGGKGDICTKEKFGDVRLHLEFQSSYEPELNRLDRSNSGVFLQGLYEVQILDSFGAAGLWNECGAIYHITPPKVNACLPPGEWQTYDILFRAARFHPDGSVSEYPRITVRQNGILIQHNEEIPAGTKSVGSKRPSPPPPVTGPIELQDHGHPVKYRNIWVAPLPDAANALLQAEQTASPSK